MNAATGATAEFADPRWRDILLIIGAGTIVRLFLGARLPLVPDEAYYWLWAQHLSIGYFDHPPMIAWLIKIGTMVLGRTALGVRIGSIAAGSVAILATAGMARRVGGNRAALLAATAMTALPLAAAGLVLATPDAPLLGAFAVALYGLVRTLEYEPGTARSFRWWVFTGCAMGLAFMSKYTSIVLPVGTTLAVLVHRPLRARLREPGPYVACVVATLMFLPVLLWNARHEWVSFAFQIDHGLGTSIGDFWRAALRHEGDLLGGQLGLVSPILLVMMGIAVVAAVRPPARPAEFVLASVSATAVLLFVYSGLRKHVEPNWPAPAYVGGIALLAVCPWGPPAQRWVRAGIALAAVLTTIIYVHVITPILPIPPAKDPIGRAFGWDALADAALLESRAPGVFPGAHTWIAANRYQDAAETAFYGGLGGNVFALNLGGRRNQFDLWPDFSQRASVGDRLVLVLDDTPEPPEVVVALTPFFASNTKGALVELKRGEAVVTTRRVYRFDGWNGGWLPAAISVPATSPPAPRPAGR